MRNTDQADALKGTLLGRFLARRKAVDEHTAQAERQGHAPAVISLGQVWVDIMMDVDDLPKPGGFAVTHNATPAVGGSYRVLQAVSAMGVHAEHAGIVGTGAWATMVREAFDEAHIEHVGPDRLDLDSGFRLVFHDREHDKKTFVARYGAEAQGNETTFNPLEPGEGDVVHISGNTLLDHTAAGIDEFMHRAGTDPSARPWRLVINPTRTLALVNDHLLEGGGFDKSMQALCEALGEALRAPLVVRAGSRGAWVREPGGETVHVEGYPTRAIHTRSAGSCHTGATCAMLARGWELTDAVRIANAAASLAIQHNHAGVPVCPSYDEAVAWAGNEEAVEHAQS